MNIWDFLKPALQKHSSMAFPDLNMTYRGLIKEVELRAAQYTSKGRMITICRQRKAEQALDILAVLCSGNTAVPLSREYGEAYVRGIENAVAQGQSGDNIAICAFTSGTTGVPKGILLSHEAIINNITAISERFVFSRDERLLIVRPMCHMSAITAELFCALYAGIEVSFFDSGFNPSRLITALRAGGATVMGTTPTVMYHCVRQLNYPLSLRRVCLSGEILTKERAEYLAGKLPDVKFYNAYGLSEHCPRVSFLEPEDFLRKPGSVGKPLSGVRVRISDGELAISSACVMQEYYNNPRATQKVLVGGELFTGDIAHIDSEGYLYIDGRKDDMIIRGGVNIMPQEIRRVLLNMPDVEDCIIYGKPDKDYGQRVAAVVYGLASEAGVRLYAAHNLPAYLVPSEIRVCPEIPVGLGGKLKPGYTAGGEARRPEEVHV